MSKKDVASDAGTGTTSESTTDETGVVDIGITVDVCGDDPETDGDADTIELEFDEEERLEAAESTEASAETDTHPASALEADEREALEECDIDPDAVAEKEYSYRLLLDDGVDESVASTLRRRFSLPWSFESDGDLGRRSTEVRGLGDAEREWIAVSGDEGWQTFEYEHAGPISVGRERPSERPYPKPTPITTVAGVGPDDAEALAEAGVRSAERLATVDAMTVARLLELNVLHVRTWRHNARELLK
ncbi:helix-hairpin-helix domain-containing protein [Natrinema zhouii]|uniref:Helix-hairpin-helix domain-containing protein n=1 Tax=Natrinema zhouii TaxID=1710539 RepID=A0A7D6H5R6_9EURY|nr:helix-hairpin-helix domain-containing protein [Natrinema zhouii]QLK25708.1 helix-hairpin-helix domain-containing protein [Natrinema zhouii]